MTTTREAILDRVRNALQTGVSQPMPQLPALPRLDGDASARIAATLAAIENVSGKTRRVPSPADLRNALAELIGAEKIGKALLWDNADLRELRVAETLAELGVAILAPAADKHELAQCDLGVTGADAVLPQTGSIALRALPGQSELVSLLPRVHLALFRPSALRADLYDMLTLLKHDSHAVLITGPSRTADIEKTLAIGVHGPKVFYAWSYEG